MFSSSKKPATKLQGITVTDGLGNTRVVHVTPNVIATALARKERCHQIGLELRSGRMLPSSRSNQFAGWQATPCTTAEHTLEAKISRMLSKIR